MSHHSKHTIGVRIAFLALTSAACLATCENPLAEVASTLRSKAASPTISISVDGASVPSGGAADLGGVLVGASLRATVTVSNSGATALVIDASRISIAGAASAFSIDASSFSGSIEPGAGSSFAVAFSPAGATGYSATLTIPSNDVETPSYSCALSGTGLLTPNAPTGIGASSGDSQATVVWNAVAGAESYNLYYSTVSGSGKAGTKVMGVASPYALSGLANGTTYYITLTTIGAGLESAASTQVQATPQVTASGAPTEVKAVAGNMSATVTWTAVGGATGYNIYYSAGSPPNGSSNKVVNASSGCVIKELNPLATYYFVVTAFNPSESDFSSLCAMQPKPTPYAPTISASALGSGSIRVTADLNDYAPGYTLYYSTSSDVSPSSYQGSSTGYSTDSGADTVTFDVTGLSAGTTYYFTMTSANGTYVSGASNRASAPSYPVAPTIAVNSILVDNGNVKLPWTAEGNGSGVTYAILRSTDGVTYSAAASGLAASPYLDTGLANWTTYYYKVRAVADDSSIAVESAAVGATPVHQALAVLNLNSNSLDINLIQSPAYSASRLAAGTWYNAAQATSGVVVGSGPSSLVQDSSLSYIYVGNTNNAIPSALGVYGFSVNADGVTGTQVAAVSNTVYHEGLAIATKGGTQYLYATDSGTNGIYVYQVAASGGGLSQLTDAVASAAGSSLRAVSVTPDSKYLYVSNYLGSKLSAFVIGSDGKLTKIDDYPCAAQPYKSAVSPDGEYLYVANCGAERVTAYSIDQGTGVLSSIGTYAVGANPTSVAVDATSSYAYVACGGANAVYSFSIGSGGALSQIGSALSTWGNPYHLSIDFGNQCLAVACAGSNLVALYSIDRASGALTHTINAGTAIYPGFAAWIKLP